MPAANISILPASNHRASIGTAAMDNANDRILRLSAVLERTGLTRSTLYRKIQQGSFPKQIAISTRCAGWRESEINAWMRNPMFFSVADRV